MIRQDLHIHTHLSSCSGDPQQTPANILVRTAELGMDQICFTDHFWDQTVAGASEWYKPQNLEHIRRSLSELPKGEHAVDVFFGCESEFTGGGGVGISKQIAMEMDFVLIPISHFHMKGYVRPMQIDTADELADLWITRYREFLQLDLPWSRVGLAHVTDCCIGTLQEEFLQTVLRRPLKDIFMETAEMGVSIEINGSSILLDATAQMNLDMYGLMKACGCQFTLGSDAHSLDKLDRINDAEEFAKRVGFDDGDFKVL